MMKNKTHWSEMNENPTIEDLEKLAYARRDIMKEIKDLQYKKASLEITVAELLVENKMFEFLTVDWRKLERLG